MHLWKLSILCLMILSTTLNLGTARAAGKPNVLFLFTDDQRADTIGALGNPLIQTPNLDGLVNSGFVFRRAYCMGSNSGAVCFPSRNMLLSGRGYFRFKRFAEADKPNFPKSMNDAGYETYHHGKLGNTAREIHKVFHHSKYLKDNEARMLGEPGQEIVDNAISFVNKRSDDKPFFMYLAFSTPHDPRVANKKYMKLYKRDEIPLPKNYMPVHPFDNGEMVVRDEQLAPWPRTEAVVRKHLHNYYAVITGLDHHIGRLLKSLKEKGEYDNTIIIFSSDHGLAIGSHGLFGKQSLYEHSMKSPLFISGPGVPKGDSNAFVYLHDIYPTVCDLVGAPIPDGLDGRSFNPVIEGKTETVRNSVFTAYKNVQRSVRNDRWKLIQYPQINRTQLFDLKTDPDELRNLAYDASYYSLTQRMFKLMKKSQQELGDTDALTSEKPKDPTFTIPEPGSLKKKKKRKKKS